MLADIELQRLHSAISFTERTLVNESTMEIIKKEEVKAKDEKEEEVEEEEDKRYFDSTRPRLTNPQKEQHNLYVLYTSFHSDFSYHIYPFIHFPLFLALRIW